MIDGFLQSVISAPLHSASISGLFFGMIFKNSSFEHVFDFYLGSLNAPPSMVSRLSMDNFTVWSYDNCFGDDSSSEFLHMITL